MADNVTRPSQKPLWGWEQGADGTIVPTNVKAGDKAPEFGGPVKTEVEPRGNGGGSDTIKDLKAKLDEKGIEYKATASKAELQALLDGAGKSDEKKDEVTL